MRLLDASLLYEIEEGVRVLKRGGLVAYPTDTVYGLGAAMDSEEGVEKVFRVKSRPRGMPLPVLVASKKEIEVLARGLSADALLLIDTFLPGALTLIVAASERVPGFLKSVEGTIALRIPNHAVALTLIERLGTGIVGTSANLSGLPSAHTAQEVKAQLGGRIDLIIDGGRTPGGVESTIVDVTGAIPRLVRKGAIPVQDIEKACGKTLAGDGG